MRSLLLFFALLSAACTPSGSTSSEHPTAPEPGAKETDEGRAGCKLSEIGLRVHEAAISGPADVSSVPAERLLTYDNAVDEALLDGEAIFTRLGDLIAEANVDVNIAMFVFEPATDPWNAIVDGLTRLSNRLVDQEGDPVTVRIIIDSNNLIGNGESARANARALTELNLPSDLVEVQVASRGSYIRGAMHQKLAIIDGSVVHIGGANVQGRHNWTTGIQPWRDLAVVLRGDVAGSLLFDFERMWNESEVWECGGDDCTSKDAEPFERAPTTAAPGCIPMISLTRLPRGGINNDIDHPHGRGFVAAMDSAESLLRIQTPNLNDDAAVESILRAITRGVRVELVIPIAFNDGAESLPSNGGTNRVNVDQLYAAVSNQVGTELACELFRVRWFGQPDVGVVVGNIEGQAHVKYMSVDGQLVIVGSTNMDTQSWNHSGEANVAIDDQATTERFDREVFEVSFGTSVPTGHCSTYFSGG